jgi:hypothetical protein
MSTLEVKIGAQRQLVVRGGPGNREAMKVLTPQRHGIADGQFDAGSQEDIRVPGRPQIGTQPPRGVDDEIVRGRDA